MKKSISFLALAASLILSASAATPQSGEIFDLLRKGDVAAVRALIEKSPQLVDARDGDGNAPLHHAANGRDAALVQFLIDKGAKIGSAGLQSNTPLHIAASNDRREIASLLLEHGASLEAKNDYGRSPRDGESHAYWVSAAAIEKVRQVGNLADPDYRNGVLRKIGDIVESKYVLADRAKGFADAFRAKCASGSYDAFAKPAEFAAKVNADLVAITGDKHLNFRVIVPSAAGEKAASSLHHPVRYYLLRKKENAGFSKLEWIEPGIGYLELRRFNSFGEARNMAVAAMTFLSNARAIIIDVRENGGGSGDYLSSYFLPYPTQLSGDYSRLDGRLHESWTVRDIGMKPRTDVPVFILAGPNTFSAAEGFAYDMKTRKRATIVGEPTKGGAHSVDVFGIDDQFEFYISTARAVSPVTGGNWEGTGVLPDIAVPASAALETAVREARKAAEAFGRDEDERLKKSVERMQAYADDAARLYRENEAVSADAALNGMFEIARTAGLISEFFIDVFAYNFSSPQDERMLFAILERAIRFFPDSPTAYEQLGDTHYSKGHGDLALRYLQRAVALDPGLRDAAKIIQELRERK